jgi:hypothetical protein
VFVVPEAGGHAPPPALADRPLDDASPIIMCLFLGPRLVVSDDSSLRLEQIHQQFHRHPQLLIVVLPPSSSPQAVWQSLNPLIVRFRTLVVARFVTPAEYDLLEEADVQRMREVFQELTTNAKILEQALVQKECLWAEENASNYLVTAKDLINNELQHPVAGARFFVAGNMFLSAADAQFSVFLDTSALGVAYQADLQLHSTVDALAAIASRSRLILESSSARAEFVVTVVDGDYDFQSIAHRSPRFFVVLLQRPDSSDRPDRDESFRVFDALVLSTRETLEAKRVGFDLVVLRPSSDDKDLLAALDCGLRNAKHSYAAEQATRSDTLSDDLVSQDSIDESINSALVKIRAAKRNP